MDLLLWNLLKVEMQRDVFAIWMEANLMVQKSLLNFPGLIEIDAEIEVKAAVGAEVGAEVAVENLLLLLLVVVAAVVLVAVALDLLVVVIIVFELKGFLVMLVGKILKIISVVQGMLFFQMFFEIAPDDQRELSNSSFQKI